MPLFVWRYKGQLWWRKMFWCLPPLVLYLFVPLANRAPHMSLGGTGLDAYWHVVWTRVLIRDITPYAGIALDVRNAGEHQGTFQLQIRDHKSKNFHRSYGLMPGESYTIVISIEEMTENMDTADIKAAQFLTVKRPETDLRFQMGPLVAIPK